MQQSPHTVSLDRQLTNVEALFLQRHPGDAVQALAHLAEADFTASSSDHALYFLLEAQRWQHAGEYRKAIEFGLKSTRLFADSPHTIRYGRALLVLAHAYFSVGDLRNADIRSRDALASFRRAGDVEGQIDALSTQARTHFTRCEYPSAAALLDDAIAICSRYPRKLAQLTGNAGRIKLLSGFWVEAETDLRAAVRYDEENGEEISLAINLLSLGYLQFRRRESAAADKTWKRAAALIEKHQLRRERVILLEYTGELALERADLYKAKSILTEAIHQGRLIAPDSALVSQASRRLAEVELAMDNLGESMKAAQKGLALAQQLGEKSEIALSRRAIAQLLMQHGEPDAALEHISASIELLREVSDPYDLARTLLCAAELCAAASIDESEKIRGFYDEAARIFKRLKVDYWLAEADFRAGMFSCQRGELSRGFKRISRAERLFATLSDAGKLRQVQHYLATLADQAVALSISQANSYKLFGDVIGSSGAAKGADSSIDDLLRLLKDHTHSSRIVVFSPHFPELPIISLSELSNDCAKRFTDRFQKMIGQEVSRLKPTLMLDCRRDPVINDLFSDLPELIASVIVVPFRSGDKHTSYLYLDRTSVDNGLDPYGQEDLNFAVGMSDLIAFSAASTQKGKLLEDNRRLKAQLRKEAAFTSFITVNRELLDTLNQVRQVVDASVSVLIEGETGCGKDLLARAIHYNSARKDHRFISVNCAALPETLLESELFGFRRGAFTGADKDKIGLLEEADGGTFFLDEIADMPLSIQVKLLRALEAGEIVRLGESVPRRIDVRFLSACNKDLKIEMAAGRFRSDLFYRLAAISFTLPPLRDRREDIPVLAHHFLSESGKRLTPDALHILVAYDWPGNVRELDNELKKLVLLAGSRPEIGIDLLSAKLTRASAAQASQQADSRVDLSFSSGYSLYDFLSSHERRFIIRALKDANGVKKHAAESLHIPESTLRLKIKEYALDLSRLAELN